MAEVTQSAEAFADQVAVTEYENTFARWVIAARMAIVQGGDIPALEAFVQPSKGE